MMDGMQKTMTLRGLFWATSVVAMFLAAWTYLQVTSNVRHFWLAWALACLGIAAVRLIELLVQSLKLRR